MNNEVIVLFGAGSIGEAIVRRVAAGRNLLLADYNEAKLVEMKQHLTEAGFNVKTIQADLSSRESIKTVVAKAQSRLAFHHPKRAQNKCSKWTFTGLPFC